jgi:hypothetical protein
MRKELGRRHDAHVRANSVCAEHSAIFDASPGGQKARATLANNVASVTRLFITQGQAVEDGKAASERSRQARVRLREAAKSVVAVGKIVSLPEAVTSTLQLPGTMTDDELLQYAGTLLERVSAHADAFLAEGLPPDLLKNLADGIQALSDAREQGAHARQRFAAAAASIRETQDRSDKTVRALVAFALNTPAARPEVLTKLRVAKRVGPRAKAAENTPAPATTPVATPSSTPSNDQAV